MIFVVLDQYAIISTLIISVDSFNSYFYCKKSFVCKICVPHVACWPRAGSGAVSKWVICACDSLVDFGAV